MCSHHQAIRKSLASASLGLIIWIPNGNPDEDKPDGMVIAGRPQYVQGPWNMVLPVLDKSARAGVGVEGVIKTSTCSVKISMSRTNFMRRSFALE